MIKAVNDHEEGNRPPLLSICIPTYNRAPYLRETLECLGAALKGFEDEVEVIVSDNASPDHTQEVLAEFESRIPNFRHSRNSVNIGEMNFFRVMHLARGKYIWILGDDDREDPRLIATLMEKFRSDCDMVIMNHSVHSKDFQCTYKTAIHSVSARELYEGKDMILSEFGPMLSFISCVVIKKELLLSISEEKFRYYATYGLSFLYSVYACLPSNATALFIQKPLLHCRGGNSAIPDYERVFVQGMALTFDELAGMGYSKKASKSSKEKVIRMYLLPFVVRCKLEGSFFWKMVNRIQSGFGQCGPSYVLLLLYASTPTGVIAIAKKAQKTFKNITDI
jgi:glycosyltransferase involved in cell wall biosynthesis